MSGRGVISIGLEKKYGLRPSWLLYCRGGRGKEIHTEGGLSPCSRGSEGQGVRYHTTDLCLLTLIAGWAMLEFGVTLAAP